MLELLRSIKAKNIYISADGPRENRPDEFQKCEATRKVFEHIDWDSEVKHLYRDKNLGCQKAVHGGISWFFEEVEEGIILEDDCIVDESFFLMAEILLKKYRDNEKIMHISAHNPLGESSIDESYFFSKQALVWGWATWRRAWKKMDLEMEALDPFLMKGDLTSYIQYKPAQQYIIEKWKAARDGQLDSWAYPWAFSSFIAGGLSIIPRNNLVHNIGFDEEATNTNNHQPTTVGKKIDFPLKHPSQFSVSEDMEKQVFFHSQKSRLGLIFRQSMLYKLYVFFN